VEGTGYEYGRKEGTSYMYEGINEMMREDETLRYERNRFPFNFNGVFTGVQHK
jgi:hypothetical protein